MGDGDYSHRKIFHRHKIFFQWLFHGLQLFQDGGILFHNFICRLLSRIQCQGRVSRSGKIQHQGYRGIQYPDTHVGPYNHPASPLLI